MRLMPSLTHVQYEKLERAVTHGQRIAVYRRGSEYIVIPLALHTRGGREMLEARNPTTGDALNLYLDELDSVETIGS